MKKQVNAWVRFAQVKDFLSFANIVEKKVMEALKRT